MLQRIDSAGWKKARFRTPDTKAVQDLKSQITDNLDTADSLLGLAYEAVANESAFREGREALEKAFQGFARVERLAIPNDELAGLKALGQRYNDIHERKYAPARKARIAFYEGSEEFQKILKSSRRHVRLAVSSVIPSLVDGATLDIENPRTGWGRLYSEVDSIDSFCAWYETSLKPKLDAKAEKERQRQAAETYTADREALGRRAVGATEHAWLSEGITRLIDSHWTFSSDSIDELKAEVVIGALANGEAIQATCQVPVEQSRFPVALNWFRLTSLETLARFIENGPSALIALAQQAPNPLDRFNDSDIS